MGCASVAGLNNDDPANRRFHAQPNACSECGPAIWFASNEQAQSVTAGPSVAQGDPLGTTTTALRDGLIVATKGLGGFHLVCDAANRETVSLLRERKGRVDKPFAVMSRSLDEVREFAFVSSEELALLESRERPIVLLQKRVGTSHEEMLDSVAPGNDFVGVMLPYTPLHSLMVDAISPLVVTSGNITDEPIARTNEDAAVRLANLADAFVFHDRDIHVVCDDSVVRCVENRLLPIRRSRGYAPMPVQLGGLGPDVLAVGGEIKAAFCVAKGNYAYLSQHIGDVGNIETLDALQRNVDHFLQLFRIRPEVVVGDMHPEYLSTQWARRLADKLGVPYVPVQHHFAHAVSLIAEHELPETESIIACCFDGTGFGADGAIWGGEFMIANAMGFERVAHLRNFPLPGGDSSIKRPYRSALALLWLLGIEWDDRLPAVAAAPEPERTVLRKQLEANLRCVPTSSMGRLFDAVASLIGVRHVVSYEAQAAMEMEAMASGVDDVATEAYSFELVGSSPIQIACQSVVESVCADIAAGVAPAVIAARFHHAVAKVVCAVCERIRDETGLFRVGLTGGVFQDVLLLQWAQRSLREKGFEVLTHRIVPPNDGGLALGQALAARIHL